MSSTSSTPLARFLRLVRLSITAELRNPALFVAGLVTALGVGVFAWNAGTIAPSTSLLLAGVLGRAFGVAACLWFAYNSVRDQNDKAGAMLRSKPVDGAYWVLLNWVSGIALWLLLTNPVLANEVADSNSLMPLMRTLVVSVGRAIAAVLAYL